ncbi:MAG: outer membrane protein assembly factor BamB [Bradymonadia bacterium]|jgi:outer membrane protein assembly factor BamB
MTLHPPISARLSFGGAWRRDLRWLSDGHLLAPDFDVVSGSVDLVVARVNITEQIPPEPMLPFLRRWADALERLAAGACWADVQFEESPWTIGLVRIGEDDVELSVFRYNIQAEVIDAPAPTSLSLLLSMTRGALRELRTESPWAEPCAALASRLALPVTVPRPRARPRGTPLEIRTSQAEVGAWCTTLQADHLPFWAYDGEGLSRSALIGPGRLHFVSAGGDAVTLATRPLPAVEALADALIELFTASPVGPRDVEMGGGRLRWTPRARRLEISQDHALVEVDAADFLSLFADHIDGIVRALGTAHRPMSTNGYLGLWSDLASELLRLDPAAHAVVATPKRRSVTTSPSPPEDAASTLGFPVRSVRQLRFSLEWTHRISQDDARTWVSDHAAGWVGVQGQALMCVDAVTGEQRWRAEQHGARRILVAADEVLAIGGRATLHDAETGSVRWVDDVDESVAHARRVDGAWMLSSDTRLRLMRDGRAAWTWLAGESRQVRRSTLLEDTAVAALSGGRIVGLDARLGRPLWQLREPVQRARIAPLGRRLLVWSQGAAATGERCILADATTGAVIAACSLRGDVRRWSFVGTSAALLVGGDSDVVVLAQASDDSVTELTTPERILDVVAGDGFVVAMGRSHVWALDDQGVRWSLPHRTRQAPLFANRQHASGIISLRDDDGVRFVESWSGDVLGESTAFWEEVERLTMSAKGHCLVVERAPRGSAWLHGVAALGLLAVLDGGQTS